MKKTGKFKFRKSKISADFGINDWMILDALKMLNKADCKSTQIKPSVQNENE